MSTAVKLSIDAGVLERLEAFHESVRTRAITIIQSTLPAKVLELTERLDAINADKHALLSKHHYLHPDALATDTTVYPPASSSSSTNTGPAAKKRKAQDAPNGIDDGDGDGDHNEGVYPGIIHASAYLQKVWDDLRTEWDEMIAMMDSLKMYINLQMPQIEDGDTFGVSVQEEALNEVVRTQDSAYNLLSTPFSNYGVRGDLAAKLVRYPGVEDYALALREHDRKAIYRAHMQLVDTRNMYAVVLDILRKNIAKISKPKSGNQMGSYG